MKHYLPSLFLASLAFLFLGCAPQQPPRVQPKVVKPKPKKPVYVPKPPKKEVELKEVEDTNFSSEYMYPETDKKKKKPVEEPSETIVTSDASPMTKEACIAMIGQVKFDKYTEMFGSEAASIKRCQMLKAI